MADRFDSDALQQKIRGAAYDFRYDKRIILRFDKLSPTSNGLYAWVELRNGDLNSPPFHFGRYDLMGPRTQDSLAKAGRVRNDSYPWDDLVTRCIYSVVQAHLEGPEPVDLMDTVPDGRPKFLIRPNVMASGATTVAAAGGTGKSLYAMACGLTVCMNTPRFLGVKPEISGPVMYVDWEADAETHNERLHALCADGDLPGKNLLIYAPQKLPLRRVSDSIAKYADTFGVVMVIVDSVMLARGGEANYSDPTIDFYAALREIGRPALLIDHKSREAIKKGRQGAFGSIVNENSARAVWDLGGAHPLPTNSSDHSSKAIKLRMGKRNNVGNIADLAYRVDIWSDDQGRMKKAKFTGINPKDITAAGSPDADAGEDVKKIAAYLGSDTQPRTVAEIAENTGIAADSVRVYLNRSDWFRDTGQRRGRSKLWHMANYDDGQEPLPDNII